MELEGKKTGKRAYRDLKKRLLKGIYIMIFSMLFFSGCSREVLNKEVPDNSSESSERLSYMIYYGTLDDTVIEKAKQYDMVIVHPQFGNVTRQQVQEIRSGGTLVFGYVSIGEDVRTADITPEQMHKDTRFKGDGTGPRIGRKGFASGLAGEDSPGGVGYASYYLDDRDQDGKPDINMDSACAYTNIGDPLWFDELEAMTIDGEAKVPGIQEILSNDYGRGLGCDGVFLDNIDTCAPDSFTEESSPNKMRFEWTAPGVSSFMERLKGKYPDKLIIQNRGLFFYHQQLPHYQYTPREYVDYLMVEGYMLDSNDEQPYDKVFFADNKYNYAPKLRAEAGRPDGFHILSLGYAEGPDTLELQDTLLGNSTVGMDILMEDINQTQNEMGFSHYITDKKKLLVNDFVGKHREEDDDSPPFWSSVYSDASIWPARETEARVGIGQIEPIENGMIVRWDVAIDKSDVAYTLYYQKTPFDFDADPDLKKAEQVELIPEIGDGYGEAGSSAYPYQAAVTGMDGGEQYYFIIRARDCSSKQNEEKNIAVKTAIPLRIPSYMIYYGGLNDEVIETLKQYDVVIVHPKGGNITQEQIQKIRAGGTKVLGYISIGEDLRTAGLTSEQMLKDRRFRGDKTGPRVNPGSHDSEEFNPLGKQSPGGTGYASYYLDDNDLDGKPDMNANFKCAFTNIGDPAWYEELNQMTIDGEDQIPGIREILTYDYGRGLGCDGLFLDTIDTCAPDSYTTDDEPNKTRFEWTAPGVSGFMKRLKEEYPDKLILQNRGVFFYNPELPHYKYNPREYVDYLLFESYMLDSDPTRLYYEPFFKDNKNNFTPKLTAEADRPDGFRILSLGYAEGPEEFELKDTLLGKSGVGLDILMEDLNQSHEEAGFSHYITDQSVTMANDFVLSHKEKKMFPHRCGAVWAINIFCSYLTYRNRG